MVNIVLFPLNIKFENLYLAKHPIRTQSTYLIISDFINLLDEQFRFG